MAKQQTFSDKAKARLKSDSVMVKFIKTEKTEKGSYKFKESMVKLPDLTKVSDLK